MQPLAEIQAIIAKLPQEAATKPILAGLAEHLESFSSNLAAMRQEIDAPKEPSAPSHPPGLCGDRGCADCVAQGQELVAAGRGAVQEDIDTALEWAGGLVLQEKVAAIVGKWLSEGRPQPTREPYLTISLE